MTCVNIFLSKVNIRHAILLKHKKTVLLIYKPVFHNTQLHCHQI